VNTLALRTDVGGDPSFQQLLARAKGAAAEAFQRADAPFASVVSALKLDRSASYNPVYQVPNAERLQHTFNLCLSKINCQSVLSRVPCRTCLNFRSGDPIPAPNGQTSHAGAVDS
jgi:hypothetical protein